jgi:hypothetical protein
VIVVDTSALMALLLSEPCGDEIADALVDEAQVVISAGTLAEALIVAGHRGLSEEMEMLLSGVASRWKTFLLQAPGPSQTRTLSGGRAFTPPDSTLETASRTFAQDLMMHRCSLSGTTFPGRMSLRH